MRSTLYPKLFFLKLFILLTLSQGVFANITILNVTNSPDTTNYYAQYQMTALTGFGNTNLDANTDSIFVVFNSNTTVPGSIDPSLITVNSLQANAVSVSGQRLAILTPVNIAKNMGIFVVVIDANADIRNPSSSGSYTLQAATSKETTLMTSPSYTIYQSISTVTAAAVTPNPSVEGNAAAYTIGFDVGSGGFLTASLSTITVVFPSETTVPNGTLSGVTVNSTSASATANNDTVVIASPVNVDNNGSVQLNFAVGAGLENPTAGSYTLSVKTSSEDTLIDSDTYTISSADQLSVSAITTKPDTVNEGGEFQFEFVTGSSGALSATVDTIVVVFQQNTFVPSSISSSNVTVSSGGFSDNATNVIVKKASAADDDSVLVVTPIDVGNSANVTLTLSSGAGYLNPSVAGNYTMKLRTSQETTAVESNPYSVFNTLTTVSQANVTPGDNSTGATTSYSINFNLGDLGRLKSGESTITLSFNSLYGISLAEGDYDESKMVIGGTDTLSILGGTDINPDNIAKTIQVTVPSTADINNGDNILIILDGLTTDPITNPTASGNYLLGVKTSVETTNINSATYNIGGTSITINSVTLSDATVNNSSQYTFNISTLTKLQAEASDYIKIIFPEGTTLPGTIATTNMTIDGVNPSSISVNQSAKSVTANVSQNNLNPLNPGMFDVIILSAANVINPTVPSSTFYTVTMHTSKDQNPVTSAAYAITGDNTSVTAVSASASPSVINRENVAYTVNFTTSTTGKIAGGTAAGSSTITLDFDSGTDVPTSITATTVEVNSNSAQSVSVLTSGIGGAIEVTMPNGLTIGNSTAVTVDFDTSAGLDNLSQLINNISVETSSDTLSATGEYTLSTSSPLSVTSVTPNPTTQNANASYSVKFTTGDPDGALIAGVDSIRIVFPSNTQIPAAVSLNDVTVNGTNPATNPRVGTGAGVDTLIIAVPQDLAAGASVTVLINQSAGFLNPTLVQSYTLEVITTAESGPFISPAYNITQTSSTVSAATVTVETPTPALTSKYTIDFNVGSNGRLLGGTSTITITFNGSTSVDSTAANYNNTSITVDAVPTTIPSTDISISGQAVTLTIPSTVSVDNNENVSIILDGTVKPITNPSSSGEYTLEVKTSVEISNITSNSYTISSDSPVTNISVIVDSDIVNDTSTNTVSFRAQNPLSAGSGTITVTFPSNTFIPSSISTANVKVASGASFPQPFNNAAGVSTNPSIRVITVTVPSGKTVDAGDSVRVVFLTAAGIENPSISGNYTLNVKTSSQGLDGTSAPYNLTATLTTIQNLSVDITPVAPSEIGRYEYDFTTGIRGRLVSGTSTITLLIPYDADFTLGTPPTSKVTVNSTAAAAVVLNEGDPHELIITVPSSVTIGNSAGVTVVIDESAGLRNSPRTIPLFYNVYTSVETASVQTDFSLPVELTLFQSEIKNNVVVLSWVTESELENAYWWILRKEVSKDEYNQLLNGSLKIEDSKNQFETVAQIEGRGNTSEKSFYNYEDNTVEVGKVYAYRLVDISYNGLTTYHDVIYQEVKAPMTFALEQNFPNPFNPSTNIKYSIPVEATVELRIFNILGQEVKTLVDQITRAGFYNVEWDGIDNFNQRVASGIYIYSFIVKSVDGKQGFKQVRKMILIK
ncbi:MAG: hypothetical protein KAV45_06715 [Calditrichia bacterium]|nr:hypothetical protein [Calditrichia bacterium]